MVAKHGLNPHFPVVTGRHQLTAEWSIDLPGEFNRRIDDGDLVFWRPGITAFVAIWNTTTPRASAPGWPGFEGT